MITENAYLDKNKKHKKQKVKVIEKSRKDAKWQ